MMKRKGMIGISLYYIDFFFYMACSKWLLNCLLCLCFSSVKIQLHFSVAILLICLNVTSTECLICWTLSWPHHSFQTSSLTKKKKPSHCYFSAIIHSEPNPVYALIKCRSLLCSISKHSKSLTFCQSTESKIAFLIFFENICLRE